jgi:hypothetical protein
MNACTILITKPVGLPHFENKGECVNIRLKRILDKGVTMRQGR